MIYYCTRDEDGTILYDGIPFRSFLEEMSGHEWTDEDWESFKKQHINDAPNEDQYLQDLLKSF